MRTKPEVLSAEDRGTYEAVDKMASLFLDSNGYVNLEDILDVGKLLYLDEHSQYVYSLLKDIRESSAGSPALKLSELQAQVAARVGHNHSPEAREKVFRLMDQG